MQTENVNATYSPKNTTEQSVKSCYAVLYTLEDRKWVVCGEGEWSEVHLCCDSADGSYRLLGRTVKSQQILLNANCTTECVYKEKSQNFHSFTDENGVRYGFGFYKSDSGQKQAEHFLKAVVDVIEECKKKNGELNGFSLDNLKVDTTGTSSISTQRQSSTPAEPVSHLESRPSVQIKPPPIPTTVKPPPVPTTRTTISVPRTQIEVNNSNDNNNFNRSVSRSMDTGIADYSNTKVTSTTDNTTTESTNEGGGLPIPIYEDEEEEVKTQPLSPVTAAVNNFHFEAKKKMSLADVNQPEYHLESARINSAPKGTPKLGKLTAIPAKPQKFQKQDTKISDVTFVERTVQVTYDIDSGVFHGLPREWEELLNKQFGVSPKHIPGVKLPQYTAKIPKVLVILKEKLVGANGYQQVGIFRLAPDARDNNAVKSSIDAGKFEVNGGQADVNVYANLIKVWFRDLPDPLLNCVAPEKVEMATKESDVVKIISDFPEPHKSIFLWLCDMCVECAVYENVNKMGPKNLAIVIGPNLFNTDDFENPMKAMTYSAKVVDFFEKAIKWRQSAQ